MVYQRNLIPLNYNLKVVESSSLESENTTSWLFKEEPTLFLREIFLTDAANDRTHLLTRIPL